MSPNADGDRRLSPAGRSPRLRVGVNLVWLVPGVVGGSEEYLVRSLLALPPPTAPAGGAAVATSGAADVANRSGATSGASGVAGVAGAEPEVPEVAEVPEVPEVAEVPEVTVFGLDALAEAHPELADRFELVTLPLRGRLKAARVAAESTWLALQARRRRLDVVHHGGGVLPLWAPARTVVTIHDLQPLEFPDAFGSTKRRWLGRMLPRTAWRADLVVTTSDFVRRGIIERLGTPPARVALVPPCLTPGPTPPSGGGPAATAGSGGRGLRDVCGRYGVAGRFVMYPAITYGHKNHTVLVEAVASDAWPADLHLVLPGGAAQAEAPLAARIDALAPDRRRLVHRLGRIPRADLDVLLAGAEALAFPSTYEGFGIGALEAMAAGTPVVASRAGALPEVLGGAGRLVDPHDPAAWASALARVATATPGERAQLAAAGRARASLFTPARTGAALLDAWHRAAGVDAWQRAPVADPTADPDTGPAVDPTADPDSGPAADPDTGPAADPTADPTADPKAADPKAADPTADPTTGPGVPMPRPGTPGTPTAGVDPGRTPSRSRLRAVRARSGPSRGRNA